MAKITLRAYIREIESMVEKGLIDEAIAHCQHIIGSFPKLIAAYRLLGKAYLEGQSYGDAADIFQRVLSAVPDDFTAHVGMSIIREDEANINAAIWHMERAFENQPYNPAIQEELRRLYGKRDGLEPAKIRLTRGALARMYARGSLFPQAIAELRAALADDPHRPDLQTLLARMYFRSGQQVEAVDTCSSLIKKLPYCLEANRILAKILPETGRKEDSQAYNQRVNALDPYLLHASPDSPNADEVPDNLVMLDKLDFVDSHAAGEITSQPEWAASLGVQVERLAPKDEPLPEWLSGDSENAEPGVVPPFEVDPTDEESSLIPEWMKQAGWRPGSGEPEPPTFEEPESYEPEESEAEIEPAEIPDWLLEMAPEGSIGETAVETPGEELPEWLQEITPESAPEAESPPAGPPLQFPSEEFTAAKETDVPDWLRELAPDVAEPAADEEVPSWLKELSGESAQAEDEGAGREIPESQEEAAAQAVAGVEEYEEEIPGWLQEQPGETPVVPAQAVPEEPELPAWLQETGIEEEPPLTASGSPEDVEPEAGAVAAEPEIPDWLQELSPKGPEAPVEIPDDETAAEGETAPVESDLPDWLLELSAEEELAEDTPPGAIGAGSTAPEAAASLETDLPDWLREITAGQMEETPGAGEPEPELFAEEETGLTEWVQEQAPEDTEMPAVSQTPPMPDLTDPDTALAWLESLAARQGAPEEELITEPGARPAEAPVEMHLAEESSEEILESELEAVETPSLIEEPVELETGDVVEAFETGEEISETSHVPQIDDKVVEPETELGELEVPETPTAKEEVMEEIAEPEEEPQALEAPEMPSADVEIFEAEEAAPASEVLPDWLKDLVQEEEQTIGLTGEEAVEEEILPTSLEAERESLSNLEDTDAALAWLESLAAKQGVPEEELVTKPEERPQETPDWLKELPKAEEQVPEPIEKKDETPDWLKELAEAGEAEPGGSEVEQDLLAPEIPTEESPAEGIIVEPETTVSEELPAWILDAASSTFEEKTWAPPVDELSSIPEQVEEPLEKLDINTASLIELETLPGMGFIRAQKILAYREANGEFNSLDELLNIQGFSPEILQGLSPLLKVVTTKQKPASVTVPTPEPSDSSEQSLLAHARMLLNSGSIAEASEIYGRLIRKRFSLDDLIWDLKGAITKSPDDSSLWQTLGDAYMRNDQLKEALDAYNQAEQLIR